MRRKLQPLNVQPDARENTERKWLSKTPGKGPVIFCEAFVAVVSEDKMQLRDFSAVSGSGDAISLVTNLDSREEALSLVKVICEGASESGDDFRNDDEAVLVRLTATEEADEVAAYLKDRYRISSLYLRHPFSASLNQAFSLQQKLVDVCNEDTRIFSLPEEDRNSDGSFLILVRGTRIQQGSRE